MLLQRLEELPGDHLRPGFDQALAHAGKSLHDLHVALELGSNEAIKEAVQRGLGVGVLSSRTAEKQVRAGKLRALHISGLDLTRAMFVTWDKRRVLPIPARLFLDLLESMPNGVNR